MKRLILSAAALLAWMAVCALIYLYTWLHTPIDRQTESELKTIRVELAAGDSLSSVTRQLNDQGLLSFPKALIVYARLTDTTNVKLGEYDLPLSDTPVQLLDRLVSGDVMSYTVTFVEGIRVRDAMDILRSHEKIESIVDELSPLQLAQRIGLEQDNPEGWIFPSTYTFTKGTTDWSILKQGYDHMSAILSREWQNKAENLPYKTPYEALIMASIIERETGAAHEREEISGVFVRRLQKGMRLQTDPTVIYGMGDNYQGKIRRSDLRRATPYNTYVIKGLPPTPIALPGEYSIRAALNPAPGDSLYFVAKGDGTHQFSVSLAEHQAAVKKYQLERKTDYRSTVQ